ncbi:MAG: hypothetical protein AVDCRST_MAG70-1271 [uncultured Thermomicrobiales bacterium]|uniref:Uncharacterized protein n=1 Tax=uncultured Thermomicrobiales bacterium TaxID=1645740 RepID=A0A6J4UN69_9BACT|nr:MAG: hypothetical protein AVDCRST_MAG70-1271 [uncultured Thermomicrobiales bacterium]
MGCFPDDSVADVPSVQVVIGEISEPPSADRYGERYDGRALR